MLAGIRKNFSVFLFILLLALLPFVASWSQLSSTQDTLETRAEEISAITSSVRNYYAANVISRIIEAEGRAKLSEDYRNIHGGIPIPATFSIEMGAIFDGLILDQDISYSFISDYPFKNREGYKLDDFEKDSLSKFRSDPTLDKLGLAESNIFKPSKYRLASPIIMKASCVNCHNSHPGSTKTDWKVGDVRGIQVITALSGPLTSINMGWPVTTGYAFLMALLGYYNLSKYKRSRLLAINEISRLEYRIDRETRIAELAAKQLDENKIYQYSIENSIVGVTICDMTKPDSPAIYVNNAFTKITGYSKEYALGKNCRYLQGPKTNPKEIERIRHAIKAEKPYSGTLINYRSDGSIFMNQLTLIPIKSENSMKVVYYLANQIELKEIL